jgi:Sec-independent protein secretion pathway component TatC
MIQYLLTDAWRYAIFGIIIGGLLKTTVATAFLLAIPFILLGFLITLITD